MQDSVNVNASQVLSFLEVIRQELPDSRDARGRRHSLEFALAAVVLAVLSRCCSTSSIQRFIVERLEWLREVTGMKDAKPLSRSYLPVFVDRINWTALAKLVRAFFDCSLDYALWVAVDGKVLRGSSRDGEREATVLAVAHGSGVEIACAPQSGVKSSEVPVVRQLLKDTGLDEGKVSLDALHTNPQTLGQIAQAGGTYLAQVKGNQPELLTQCCTLGIQEPLLAQLTQCDKGHGRVTTRGYALIPLRPGTLDDRWGPCQPRYLIAVMREVFKCKTGSTSLESAYYVTNAQTVTDRTQQLKELSAAVQGHWGVESNNWVRDVTLGEDGVRMKAPNQSQVMSLLRGVALTLLRKFGSTNLQALTEKFCYSPDTLSAWLREAKFL